MIFRIINGLLALWMFDVLNDVYSYIPLWLTLCWLTVMFGALWAASGGVDRLNARINAAYQR